MAGQMVGELRITTDAVWGRLSAPLHWDDHAGQLATIRKAVGLPEARELAMAM